MDKPLLGRFYGPTAGCESTCLENVDIAIRILRSCECATTVLLCHLATHQAQCSFRTLALMCWPHWVRRTATAANFQFIHLSSIENHRNLMKSIYKKYLSMHSSLYQHYSTSIMFTWNISFVYDRNCHLHINIFKNHKRPIVNFHRISMYKGHLYLNAKWLCASCVFSLQAATTVGRIIGADAPTICTNSGQIWFMIHESMC